MPKTPSTRPEPAYLLQIVEVNKADGAFYVLGGAGFATEAERTLNLASIPRDGGQHDCAGADTCYTLEVIDPSDLFSVIEDFEIGAATAHALLGVEDFEPLRQQERDRVAKVLEAVA